MRQLLVDEVAAPSQSKHSRRMSMPRLRLLPALAAVAAATVGVTIGINVLGTSDAYASWTAIPDQLGGSALASAGAACKHQLAGHFNGETAGLTPAVAEKRGKFSATLVSTGPKVGICINGIPNGQLGGIVSLPAAARPGLTLVANPGLMSGPGAVRQALGQVANLSIARVVVTTEDGRRITASVGSGLYLAWWPSSSNVKVVTGYDRSGATVAIAH